MVDGGWWMVDGRPRQCRWEVGAAPKLPPGICEWPATFCLQATRAKVLQTINTINVEDLNLHDLPVTEL
jgi:hypothetical protein